MTKARAIWLGAGMMHGRRQAEGDGRLPAAEDESEHEERQQPFGGAAAPAPEARRFVAGTDEIAH